MITLNCFNIGYMSISAAYNGVGSVFLCKSYAGTCRRSGIKQRWKVDPTAHGVYNPCIHVFGAGSLSGSYNCL